MNVLTALQIRNIEQNIIDKIHIPEILLMENAAKSVADEICRHQDNHSSLAILCGFGNNSGDGYALGRLLSAIGFNVTLFHPINTDKLTPSARLNFELLQNLNANLKPIDKFIDPTPYGIIVDALFGTGLKAPINDHGCDEFFAHVINLANISTAIKIAIDVPSGLFADSSPIPDGGVFKADVTITFSALKVCLSLYPAKGLCGEVVLKNIGIPENMLKSRTTFLTKNGLPPLFKRDKTSHKGSFGRTALIGGSADMGGAPAMAAIAALKIGSGLTYLCIDNETESGFVHAYPEIIIKRINLDEHTIITDFINMPKTVALIGCGMGSGGKAAEFIRKVALSAQNILIIDADGINALTCHDLKNIKAEFAITPHLGEFARLLNISIVEVEKNRLTLARNFAETYGCVLVLKSADTIIATPTGDVSIADFGCPALSKGGSGDVLAGLMAALTAQNYSLIDAAKLAIFILGRSGNYATSDNHEMSVTATDVINYFPKALNDLQY